MFLSNNGNYEIMIELKAEKANKLYDKKSNWLPVGTHVFLNG